MLTRKDLADALGVTTQTLRDWARDHAPVDEALEWPLADAVELLTDWRNSRKRPTYKEPVEPSDAGTLQEQLLAAQVREKNAAAEKKELENAKRRGELYEADTVDLAVSELCNLVRARLESIPSELESEWPAELRTQVTTRLSEKVRLILTEMSQWRLES